MKTKAVLKFFTVVLLTALATIHLTSCERDDICAESTPTTPNAIVAFFDITDRDAAKNVNGLRVRAVGEEAFINLAASDSTTLPLLFPVENESTSIRFEIIKDANLDNDDDEDTNSNTDVIELTYVPEFEYVSRACGFRSIFNNLTISLIADENNWILDTAVTSSTIQNEDETHINIFH